MEVDKLSYEIFTILESKFLFGDSSLPPSPVKNPNSSSSASGKVRVLSIDGGGDGILAGAALSRLESTLRSLSGDQKASIADFFDVAAGSGAGGVLASMLFTRGPDGRPLFSAADALGFLSENPSFLSKRRFFSRRKSLSSSAFKRAFRGYTIRDFIKPVLIACYDLTTASPFVFSRADAVETDGYDFEVGDVCSAATCADPTAEVRSVDGKTEVVAVGGGVGMGNPTAAAITHVLHNKAEFPFADGVEDLLVVSLGNGDGANGMAKPSRKDMVKIAANCAADTVEQAVAMAFRQKNCASNYVRIQASGLFVKQKESKLAAAQGILSRRSVDSVLFRGKKVSELSNAERLDGFAEELIKEKHRRKSEPTPTVLIKQAMTPTISTTLTSSSTTPPRY